MATPWKHPATGVFYLRRQIPERLRAAFDGKALFKASLGTKIASEATVLFLQANAALEQRFEEARLRLKATGSPCPTDRDRADELVFAYFEGPERTLGGLDGVERLQLARVEVDRGLWDATPGGCSRGGPLTGQTWWEIANNTALYRDHPCRQPVNDHPAGSIWRWEDESFRPGAREAQIGRVIDQIARHFDITVANVPAGLADAVRAYLDGAPVEATKLRKRRHTAGRARADMRVEELFESWRDAMQPSLQTAHEYAGAARDFVDCVGDIPVEEIVHGDLLDYRDEAALLPKTMPKAHRLLPFSERLALHRDTDAPRVSGATLKKRIGAIQALLSFARAQKWISRNEGRDVPIIGYVKNGIAKRRT